MRHSIFCGGNLRNPFSNDLFVFKPSPRRKTALSSLSGKRLILKNPFVSHGPGERSDLRHHPQFARRCRKGYPALFANDQRVEPGGQKLEQNIPGQKSRFLRQAAPAPEEESAAAPKGLSSEASGYRNYQVKKGEYLIRIVHRSCAFCPTRSRPCSKSRK